MPASARKQVARLPARQPDRGSGHDVRSAGPATGVAGPATAASPRHSFGDVAITQGAVERPAAADPAGHGAVTVQRTAMVDGRLLKGYGELGKDTRGKASRAGPQVVNQLASWLADVSQMPDDKTTFADEAELLDTAAAVAAPPPDTFDFVFDSNASDSDSEAEDMKIEAAAPGNTRKQRFKNVYNLTKDKGRRTVRKKVFTRRKHGKRESPKVNNRVMNAGALAGLETQLAADAKTIHDVISKHRIKRGKSEANQNFGATTVVCAVFRSATGDFRKYAFTNLETKTPSNVREKAESLGYHAVNAQVSHAEGELIQYLGQRSYRYSLYAMGCDKPHCKECDWAVQKVVGEYVSGNTAEDKTYPNYYIPPAFAEQLGQDYTFDPMERDRHIKQPPKKKAKLEKD